MRGFKKNKAGEIDEHDLPTEPIPMGAVSPFLPTVDATLFPPELDTPPLQPPLSSPVSKAYPYVPTAPLVLKGKNSRSAGGAPSAADAPRKSARSKKARRRLLPLCIGLLFVCIQLLLVGRFILKIINSSPDIFSVGLLYGVSDVFVLPFQMVLQQITLPISNPIFNHIEVYTLLAILIYGLVSRILVRFLKALLNAR